MNCKQATLLLSQRQDRTLTRRETLSLRFHLLMCRGCRNFAGQMDSLRAISRGYAKGEPHSPDTDEQKP